MTDRIKTVERDPAGGWIARNPYTGEVILGDDFRWNSRASARDAVWDAKHFAKPAPDGVLVPADRCPDCYGSEVLGMKRGIRCATCNGTGNAGVKETP